MRVLAIETSCDETAAAVIAETGDPAKPWQLESNVVASQADIHRQWGGVVPELASRQHLRDICGVVERALEQAATTLDGVGAAAVIAETGDPAKPWQLKSNVVASQADIHREWGGVVPELASRQHLRDIC